VRWFETVGNAKPRRGLTPDKSDLTNRPSHPKLAYASIVVSRCFMTFQGLYLISVPSSLTTMIAAFSSVILIILGSFFNIAFIKFA
jgi:hypothetical protein